MKLSKHTLISFLLLIVIAAIYRAIPGRPWGFAPQFAMAIFGGAILKDKKMAFILPIFSLLVSDCLYQVLYSYGLTEIQGFYGGQVENYLLFTSLTVVGFYINAKNIPSIIKGSLASPSLFFILSNLFVWIGNGGFQRGKTLTGFIQTYIDGIPFYVNSVLATMVFSTLLFGGHHLMSTWVAKGEVQRAK